MALALLLVACGNGPDGAAPETAAGEDGVSAVTPEIFTGEPPKLDYAKGVDDCVFGWLEHLDVRPGMLCPDEVFCRRVYLDLTGTLPTADEAAAFLDGKDRLKRRKLVEKLLASTEFADYWAMRWGDLLRIKAEFPINLWPNAAQAYHRWVRASIVENKPYDRFARELLTSSGSNFRVGPVNFYRGMQDRSPEGIARTVSLTLMGTRAESWSEEQLAGLTACFSQVGYKKTREWKEEVVYWDPRKASQLVTNELNQVTKPPDMDVAVMPDGTRLKLGAERDPRAVFADWLINPENRWCSRAICNRVWSWLLGRGIVHEPDDLRPDNPPSNPELLALLERKLVEHKYDLRELFRLILNSRAYQLTAMGERQSPYADTYFAGYRIRRLEAEVLIDAINKITGTFDLYTSAIPEPFTYIPKDTPAVALADGSITSPFLAMFGRSPRATGEENERVNKVLPAQRLHLLNSSHIQNKIERGPGLKAIWESRQPAKQILERLYLTILSRRPTADEARVALAYSAADGRQTAGGDRSRETWMDIAWALINSDEFLFRH